MREHAVDARGRPGDGAVDPLAREQQSALDALRRAQVEQRLPQGRGIGEGGETIERGNLNHASESHDFSNAARWSADKLLRNRCAAAASPQG